MNWQTIYSKSNTQISMLRNLILDDLFKDFNSSSRIWLRKLMEPFIWTSVNRFAKIAAGFDQYVGQFGFQEGMRHILPYFVRNVSICGEDKIPKEGPLLVLSNHPGTYDSIAIAAAIPRSDLSIVAENFPLLQGLPSTSQHLIFISKDVRERMLAVRSAIRHLRDGGAILLFPGGRVEPDPALLPGAPESISNWSSSIELFIRKVPQVKVMPTIVSGVLSPKFLRFPIIRFWSGIRDPQIVAEVIQVVFQLIFPKMVQLEPKISFGVAKSVDELNAFYSDGRSTFTSIVEEAINLLNDHYRWLVGGPESENLACE